MLCQAIETHIDIDVERVLDGVSTFVYRVRSDRETFYLRVWPFADETLESEALVLAELRRLGVRVPKVIRFQEFDPLIRRSYLLTSEIPGRPLDPTDSAAVVRNVLIAAGRELGVLNSVQIQGFGRVARAPGTAPPFHGEHSSYRAFMTEYLESDLTLLATRMFSDTELAAIEQQVETHAAWLDVAQACLAHGDFDTTPILHQGGHYSGMIDLSEMRGASPLYDLGHFGLHDGHRLPMQALQWLVEGYRQVMDMPADYEAQLAFIGLLIGIRRLAHAIQLRPTVIEYQRVMANSIRQKLVVLGA